MSANEQRIGRRTILQYAAVLGAGVVGGGLLRGNVSLGRPAGAASPAAPDVTATREAELAELHALQTQVANPPVCTPAPTETPVAATATATEVPVAQAGVPLPYLDIWTITALGIAPTLGATNLMPVGQFMQVNLTLSHSSRDPQAMPLTDFVLVDSSGRFSVIDILVNQGLLGSGWGLSISPGTTDSRSLIFDVAADAGTSFVLESNVDPTFRVALKIEQRG